MKIVTGAFATLLALSVAACGSSAGGDVASNAAPVTKAGVPTTASNGGMGVWKVTTPDGVVATAKLPATAADEKLIGAAEACRVAMKGDARTWVLVTVDATNSADDASTLGGMIVESSGRPSDLESAVVTLGDWYENAPDSKARVACATTAAKLADNQGLVPAGAKGIAVLSTMTPVTSLRTLFLNVGGQHTQLTYGGS